MSWISKLENRWGVSKERVLIILLVFACTGFSVMFLKKPIVHFFTQGESNTTFSIIYYILIFPIYNLILLFYGFIFGQFKWFWDFEKKMFRRFFKKSN